MPQIVKYNRSLPCFKHIEQYFTPEEVEKIVDLEDLQNFTSGKFGGNTAENKKQRDSDIAWIYADQSSQWVFDKFSYLAGMVNHDAFMYDIDGFEFFQYTKYKENQHYEWHHDMIMEYGPWERKISATIILSDPEEYEGGELEIVSTGSPNFITTIKPKLGDVIFFASWMPHRVLPVQSGIRKSLVCWIMGKRLC